MRADRTAIHNAPLVMVLLQDAGKAVPLEYDEALPHRLALPELPHQNSLSAPKDRQPIELVVLALSVDVLSVRDVEEGGAVQLVAVPVRGVEGEVVVDEDARTVSEVIEERALILPVAIVEQIHGEFIDKNNNDPTHYINSNHSSIMASTSSLSSFLHSSLSLSPITLRHSAFSSRAITIP